MVIPPGNQLLYYKIVQYITMGIEDGRFKPGDALPSERRLEEMFGVSRTTVRKALDVLDREGYIEKIHGKGSFIARKKLVKEIPRLVSFTQHMELQGLNVSSVVLEKELRVADLSLRNLLNLPGDDCRVLYLRRLRKVNGEPLVISSSYIPAYLGVDPERDYSGSLYAYLTNELQIKLGWKEEVVEALFPSPSDAELLQIKETVPVLTVTGLVYDVEARPIEYSQQFFRGDRYKFRVDSRYYHVN